MQSPVPLLEWAVTLCSRLLAHLSHRPVHRHVRTPESGWRDCQEVLPGEAYLDNGLQAPEHFGLILP
jgi:hypothetical protein